MQHGVYVKRARIFWPGRELELHCDLSDGTRAIFEARPYLLELGVAALQGAERPDLLPAIRRPSPGDPGEYVTFEEGLATEDPMVLKLLRVSAYNVEHGDFTNGEVLFEVRENGQTV